MDGRVQCACCNTWVTPIYGGQCPNCGEYASGFDPVKELKEQEAEYWRDYHRLIANGMPKDEVLEMLEGMYGCTYDADFDDE